MPLQPAKCKHSGSGAPFSDCLDDLTPTKMSVALEDLQPEILYHILLLLTQQDIAHVKMCSKRLLCSVLRACQHWAPKVESWLASDPSSAGLLQQLRGAEQWQLQHHSHPLGVRDQSVGCSVHVSDTPSSSDDQLQPGNQQLQPSTRRNSWTEGQQLPGSPLSTASDTTQHQSTTDSSQPTPRNALVSSHARLDWRQVWSCLERAETGPWQLDAQRLTPIVFPFGFLVTFELLLQQPAPAGEPWAREQQSGGWRDCATVLSFSLDGKTVEITVDANGRVASPQRDWSQGTIKLQPGQPKLLALEVSYLFPVAAWFLHPCTLAAPKLSTANSTSSMASSGSSSCASSSTAQDPAWDSYSSAASSSNSGSLGLPQSTALCSAVSALSFSGKGSDAAAYVRNSPITVDRPRLCLDLSQGFGSFVSDPRCMDETSRNQRPNGIDKLELAGRMLWKPSKVQSWLGRLLPSIRPHGCHNSSSTVSSTSSSCRVSCSPGSGSSAGTGSMGGGCIIGTPSLGHHSRRDCCRPSFAVTVSKAAVWQVPEDIEERFVKGFEFSVVQDKAEQLLKHYGILKRHQPPPCCP